jgi:hypothetical protein
MANTFTPKPGTTYISNVKTYNPTNTGVVGRTVSSPYNPGTLINTKTGQQVGYSTTNSVPAAFSNVRSITGGGSGGGAYNPSTSGQAPTGGSTGGDSGGVDPYLQQLRDAFGGIKSAYQSELPTYDADLSNYTTQVNGSIDRAKQTLADTQQQTEQNYGQILKNALQTDREIRQRAQGTYSALGTLDSSSYMDSLGKQDESLNNTVNNIGLSKQHDISDQNSQFGAYQQDALGKIDSYTQEINRAKAGVQEAMGQADINQAASLANYIQQVQARKDAIASQLQQFKLGAATLQAQGTDVIGNLQKLNGSQAFQNFGSLLSSQLQGANDRFTVPTSTGPQGSGYINQRTGRPYTPEELHALGLA